MECEGKILVIISVFNEIEVELPRFFICNKTQIKEISALSRTFHCWDNSGELNNPEDYKTMKDRYMPAYDEELEDHLNKLLQVLDEGDEVNPLGVATNYNWGKEVEVFVFEDTP